MAEDANKTRFLKWVKSDIPDMYARVNNIADALGIRDQVPRVSSNSTPDELEMSARDMWAAAVRKELLLALMREFEERRVR
jgi:hypothetical protein